MIRALIAVALQIWFVGQLNAMDRATLDACEQKLSAIYDSCKKEHTPAECNRAATTRLCGPGFWNETYGGFIDRRIEEAADQAHNEAFKHSLPTVFVGLTKVKQTYIVAGGK